MDWYVSPPLDELLLRSALVFSELQEQAASGIRPKAADIKKWSTKAERLSKLLLLFAEPGAVRQLEEMRRKFGDMMDALGVTSEGRDKMSECAFCF